MKVSDYMPTMYEDNVEMTTIIRTDEGEMEELKKQIKNAFYDTMPAVATEKGIEQWEKLLNIQLDENEVNLEYRRARIINILTTTVPLSETWLRNNLTALVGEDNYELIVKYSDYSITINISDVFVNTALTLFDIYRPLIPANMTLTINVFGEADSYMYNGCLIREVEKTNIVSERI